MSFPFATMHANGLVPFVVLLPFKSDINHIGGKDANVRVIYETMSQKEPNILDPQSLSPFALLVEARLYVFSRSHSEEISTDGLLRNGYGEVIP